MPEKRRTIAEEVERDGGSGMSKYAWMALMGILLLVIAGFGWILRNEMQKNQQLITANQALESRLADQSAKVGLELQDKCAVQADKMFHQLGWGKPLPSNSPRAEEYVSHYNTKMNKCFLEVTIEDFRDGTTTHTLLDAFERREYAFYLWRVDDKKKYWEVPPKRCSLHAPQEDEAFCTSEDAYKAFVDRFMGA